MPTDQLDTRSRPVGSLPVNSLEETGIPWLKKTGRTFVPDQSASNQGIPLVGIEQVGSSRPDPLWSPRSVWCFAQTGSVPTRESLVGRDWTSWPVWHHAQTGRLAPANVVILLYFLIFFLFAGDSLLPVGGQPEPRIWVWLWGWLDDFGPFDRKFLLTND